MKYKLKLGIDNLKEIKSKHFALLANIGSVDYNANFSWEIFSNNFKNKFVKIFSPQHGLMGTEQANMIETNNSFNNNIEIISLYSNTRKPLLKDLKGIDEIFIDLQDVGSKYYTYIYTMALTMQAALECGINVTILDRPNPLGGYKVKGNINKLKSFVGMYEIPIEHGMTIGELALYFHEKFNIGVMPKIIKMQGFKRELTLDKYEHLWLPPSPNIPTVTSAFVYPGGCILEGTNISEGRGTTRPFEFVGAPYISQKALLKELDSQHLKGVVFKPIEFRPTFDKYQGETCKGVFVIIEDIKQFDAYLTYISIIKCIKKLYPENFKWKDPPYEYEYEKLPFDILTGDYKIREFIEQEAKLKDIEEYCKEDHKNFIKVRKEYLLY